MSVEHIIVGALGVVALALAFLAGLVAIDESDLRRPVAAWLWFAAAVVLFLVGAWAWRAF